MPELGWAEILLRLVVAAVLGGAIGAERELRDREAGFRTHLLVAVGAALFTLVSAHAWTDWSFSNREGLVFDPTRISAQVVTGIGFLGAGAIIRHGFSVRGLTTAATLWVVAAIGMASAVGYYWAAVATTVLVLVSLWPLRLLAHRLFSGWRGEQGRLVADLRTGGSAAAVVEEIERSGGRLRALEFEETGDRRRVVADLELPPGHSRATLVSSLSGRDEIVGASWTE